MRRLSFERSRCLACPSCEIACVVRHPRAGTLAGALLVGDISRAGDFYRRYREAARPPGAERGT